MADVTSYYDNPDIAKAREASQGAASNVASMTSQVNLLPFKLKEAINEKLGYNKDLIEQKNKAMENYFATPSQARLDYSNIWNPMQREALVSKATSQAYTPYANVQDILSSRMGSIGDLIGGAGAQGRADLQTAQSSADLARQNYQDLLGEAGARSNLDMEIAKLKKGSGGGLGLGDLSALMKQFGIGADTTASVPEPKPTIKPRPGTEQVSFHSPEGYWQWDWETKDWYPVEE